MNSLGQLLRGLREEQGLLLRQAAAFLEVDTAFISKLERGEKKASKEQVVKLADFLNANRDQLITLWLCDRIIYTVSEEPLAEAALKLALKNLSPKE